MIRNHLVNVLDAITLSKTLLLMANLADNLCMIWNHSLHKCVDKCLEMAKRDRATLKFAATPFLDEDRLKEADEADKGALQPIASSILMKVLYAARMARFDLLKAVANLAKKVTRWNTNCDKGCIG